MNKLIYEIARPGCGFLEVQKHTFDNPPQVKGGIPITYSKRILTEASPDEILAQPEECQCSLCNPHG